MNRESAHKIEADANVDVDNQHVSPTTFISYSRRQLYFAESLALHLQKDGIDVWFDLQQLQAGTVWSEGLKEGVGKAQQMILIVSKASLGSPHTQAEWKGFAREGYQLVLVIYEPVDLPEELRDLPTYDFRDRFNHGLHDLAAFLKGDAPPRHDGVPSANRLGISAKLPGAVWCTLAAQFGAVIICLLGLVFAVTLNVDELWRQITGPSLPGKTWFFLTMLAVTLFFALRFALPLLRHKLEYRKVKRGVIVAMILLVPAFLAASYMLDSEMQDGDRYPLNVAFFLVLIFTSFVYLVLLRRSQGLLRWMQPEEALQSLRRRLHQPLVAKSTFDVDTDSKSEGKAVTYSIHGDPADSPIVMWVDNIFKKSGHARIAPGEDTQHHIAILSNRSSQAWVNKITRAYAGKLVFIVVSTIEFTDNLAQTGRYQWVDARDGDSRDIHGLARSLSGVNASMREAALETTPAMIDSWKVPGSITLLKRVMELFGIYLLVFGLTDLIGFVMCLFGIPEVCTDGDHNIVRSLFLTMLGIACFWLTDKGLVYRKVAAPIIYGFFGVSVVLVSWLGNVLPVFLQEKWWLVSAVYLLLILYSMIKTRFWLPAISKVNSDEVGIKKSIAGAFKRKKMFIVSAWVVVIVGIAMGIQRGLV